MKVRKTLSVFGLLFSMGVAPVHATGVPTFDGMAAANFIEDMLTEAEQFQKQYETHVKQLETHMKQFQQLENTYKAISGGVNWQTLVDDPTLRTYLPQEYRDLAYKIKSSPAFNEARWRYGATSGTPNTMQELRAHRELINGVTIDDYYEVLGKQLKQVGELKNQIGNQINPSDKQNLQTRLLVEQANITSTENLIQTANKKNEALLEQIKKTERNDHIVKQYRSLRGSY